MIKELYKNLENYHVRMDNGELSIIDKEKTMQLHVKLTRRKQNSYTEGIYIFEIDLRKTVGDDLRQRIEFKHDFNSKEVVVISASGNTVIKENEVEMLLKVHTTVTAAAAITSDINKELYLSFGVIEKIVREHFEENQKLLNNWVKETDFLQDKTYVSETNKKKIEVTRKPKQIIIKFKNLKTNFEEEFLVEKDGVSYSTTEKKDNELLIFDTGFLVKSAIKNLLIKITYDVGNKRDIISMKEIQSIEPKDNYMFQRTWIKGFYEDELFEEVTKLVRNKKEIKEMQVYEIPKYEKPEIDKEELRKVKKFAERIRMSTEYKFEDENLNQKIYEYEKLMIEIRVNADKLKKEQKKNFTENFKEEECDFLILARNFNHEDIKEYLDRYITKSITDMNNMMKEVRKEYADEMDFMLQIIEKRRTI